MIVPSVISTPCYRRADIGAGFKHNAANKRRDKMQRIRTEEDCFNSAYIAEDTIVHTSVVIFRRQVNKT